MHKVSQNRRNHQHQRVYGIHRYAININKPPTLWEYCDNMWEESKTPKRPNPHVPADWSNDVDEDPRKTAISVEGLLLSHPGKMIPSTITFGLKRQSQRHGSVDLFLFPASLMPKKWSNQFRLRQVRRGRWQQGSLMNWLDSPRPVAQNPIEGWAPVRNR